MKSKLYLIASLILICGFTADPVAGPGKSYQTTTANSSATKDVVPDTQLITMRLEEAGLDYTASITSLEKTAAIIGLDKMQLKGSVIKEPNYTNNLIKYTINWNRAVLKNNSTNLDKPFISSLMVDGEIAKHTDFSAKGDIDALFTAFQKLQSGKEKLEPNDNNKTANNNKTAVNPANTTKQEKNPEIKPVVPKTNVKKDPFIFVTSDGCQIKVDPAQGVAIVQERVLTDGKETSPCGDSLTKYPLSPVYNICPVAEDITKLVAFEQFTLGYNDPKTGGRIEVRGCAPDPDKAMFMVEKGDLCPDSIGQDSVSTRSRLVYNYKGVDKIMRDCAPTNISYPVIKVIDSCAMRHDFGAGKTYQQKRTAYIKDGKTVIISSAACTDDTQTTFTHHITKDTCTPLVNGNDVILLSRKYIVVNGNKNYITECTPDDLSVKIIEEKCNSPQYTHDFTAKQSYLNKNYFYMDGEVRIEVAHCIKSQQTFSHFNDIASCNTINDDNTKTSQIYAKIFITSDNKPDNINKTYLTSCLQLGESIDYTNNAYKWQAISSRNVTINVNQAPVTAYVGWRGWSGGTGNPSLSQYGWTQQIMWSGMYYWHCDPKNTYCIMQAHDRTLPLTSNGEYCLRNQQTLALPWVTSDGITIDSNNSDASPIWDLDAATKNWMQTDTNNKQNDAALNPPNPKYQTWYKPPGTYNCTIPTCNMSVLQKYNSYKRLDGSIYNDLSAPLETKYVCGVGSKLLN